MTRGATWVRAVIKNEHHLMQARAYKAVRPYLVGALWRLRKACPAFKTVVFRADAPGNVEDAKTPPFALIFVDGTCPHEAPKAFDGLREACAELARFSDIEWLTAGDALWQLHQGTPQPECVDEQYRHVQDDHWSHCMNRTLLDARYYMRRTIYSRTVYGSHRPGHGVRIADGGNNGVTIDEWVDPIEAQIRRALREAGPLSLEPLVARISATASMRKDAFYCWDVLHACNTMQKNGVLRRTNSKASEINARFALRRTS